MRKAARFAPILLAFGLAACGADPLRYSVPPVAVDRSERISFRSVEVRSVTLPSYAASEEIYTRGADGALQSDSALLWADDPSRAVTLELSRYLAQLTGARVASEPWPFESFADARVEVRIEDMLAGDNGAFYLNGQYFVAPIDGARDRSGLFSLSAPIAEGGGPQAVAAARAAAVLDLARLIARKGLR